MRTINVVHRPKWDLCLKWWHCEWKQISLLAIVSTALLLNLFGLFPDDDTSAAGVPMLMMGCWQRFKHCVCKLSTRFDRFDHISHCFGWHWQWQHGDVFDSKKARNDELANWILQKMSSFSKLWQAQVLRVMWRQQEQLWWTNCQNEVLWFVRKTAETSKEEVQQMKQCLTNGNQWTPRDCGFEKTQCHCEISAKKLASKCENLFPNKVAKNAILVQNEDFFKKTSLCPSLLRRHFDGPVSSH